MLSGPAILRVSVLLLIAGALAALVQYWLPASPPAPPTPVAAAPAAPPAPPPIRKILTTPPVTVQGPAPVPAPSPATAPVPRAPAQAQAPSPAPMQVPSDALAFPAPSDTSATQGREEVALAERTEGPPAVGLVDLNTASVAELNRLRGGGNIGRAIAARRPYAAVNDLLTKRVLSRSVYERIREQVTVR